MPGEPVHKSSENLAETWNDDALLEAGAATDAFAQALVRVIGNQAPALGDGLDHGERTLHHFLDDDPLISFFAEFGDSFRQLPEIPHLPYSRACGADCPFDKYRKPIDALAVSGIRDDDCMRLGRANLGERAAGG